MLSPRHPAILNAPYERNKSRSKGAFGLCRAFISPLVSSSVTIWYSGVRYPPFHLPHLSLTYSSIWFPSIGTSCRKYMLSFLIVGDMFNRFPMNLFIQPYEKETVIHGLDCYVCSQWHPLISFEYKSEHSDFWRGQGPTAGDWILMEYRSRLERAVQPQCSPSNTLSDVPRWCPQKSCSIVRGLILQHFTVIWSAYGPSSQNWVSRSPVPRNIQGEWRTEHLHWLCHAWCLMDNQISPKWTYQVNLGLEFVLMLPLSYRTQTLKILYM